MRTCTKNYVEGILKLYPAYIKMIAEKEQSILNPDEFYIDQHIGGSRSGYVGRPTEQKVMTVMSDKDLEIIKNHKKAIEDTLREADFITVGIVEAYYFTSTKIDIIAKELETTPDMCNKLKRRYLGILASELKVLK